MLVFKLANDIGSVGAESRPEPKLTEVRGVVGETLRTVLALNIVKFIFKGADKVPRWLRRRRRDRRV